MTLVVLYTDDMEPITALDIPIEAHRIAADRVWRIPVLEAPRVYEWDGEPPIYAPLKTVEIWAERFVRKGQEHLVFFTKDEEFALMLRSEWLAGQRKDVQKLTKDAFMRGLVAGILG